MAVIAKERNVLTLIITIEVKPENCDALLDLIIEESQSFVRHQPGFVSANLHRNAEKTRLLNYGQWESRELYDQARARAWAAMRGKHPLRICRAARRHADRSNLPQSTSR